jgi:hypothetical protein
MKRDYYAEIREIAQEWLDINQDRDYIRDQLEDLADDLEEE